MAVICLIGAMLIEDGHSDDQKLVLAAYGTSLMTKVGLAELGIDEPSTMVRSCRARNASSRCSRQAT